MPTAAEARNEPVANALPGAASRGEIEEWRTALSAAWPPVLASRVLVSVAGVSAMVARTQLPAIDPPGVLSGLGHVGNIVASPAARFDAVWYLAIAEHG
jgi:hypothetical protein